MWRGPPSVGMRKRETPPPGGDTHHPHVLEHLMTRGRRPATHRNKLSSKPHDRIPGCEWEKTKR